MSPELTPYQEQVLRHVHQSIDANRVSTEMGIDVYTEALNLVESKLAELSNGGTHTSIQ